MSEISVHGLSRKSHIIRKNGHRACSHEKDQPAPKSTPVFGIECGLSTGRRPVLKTIKALPPGKKREGSASDKEDGRGSLLMQRRKRPR